jgi:hypothetical protein
MIRGARGSRDTYVPGTVREQALLLVIFPSSILRDYQVLNLVVKQSCGGSPSSSLRQHADGAHLLR